MKSKLNNNAITAVPAPSGASTGANGSVAMNANAGSGGSKELPNIQARSLASGLPPPNGGMSNGGAGG
jgi:hypothetical protein